MEIKQTDLKRRVERLYRLYLTHWDYVANHLSKISNPYLNKDNMGNCDLHFSYESSYGRAEIVLSKDLMIYDGVKRNFYYCHDNKYNSIPITLSGMEESALREFERYSFHVFHSRIYSSSSSSLLSSSKRCNFVINCCKNIQAWCRIFIELFSFGKNKDKR